jgi:hypothetical protein
VEFVVREKATPGSFTQKLAHWFEHGSLTVDTGREKLKVKPHIPDEIFFPTVLMHSAPFNGSLPAVPSTVPPHRLEGMANVHYVRSKSTEALQGRPLRTRRACLGFIPATKRAHFFVCACGQQK